MTPRAPPGGSPDEAARASERETLRQLERLDSALITLLAQRLGKDILKSSSKEA